MDGDPASRTGRRASLAVRWIAAIAAAANVWLATSVYGPAVDGDAVWTISAARNLAHGRGLVTSSEQLYSLWPPLYPALIAAGDLVGLDALVLLRVLHAASCAALVVLTARAVELVTESRWLGAAQACSMAASWPLFMQSIRVSSEPLFLALCAAALALVVRALEPGSRAWWGVAALSALACLQRYLGVALVASIALLFLVHGRGAAARGRWVRSIGYALLSILPLLAWTVRNYALQRKWTGGRGEARQGLGRIASDALATLHTWLDPVGWFAAVPGWAWFAAAGAIVVGLVLARRSMRGTTRALQLDAYASFVAVYVALLIGTSALWQVDPADHRLLLPALPFGVALALVGGAELVRAATRRSTLLGACARTVAIAAIGAHTCASAVATARWGTSARTEGAGGFHTRFWMEHPLVARLRAHPVSGVVRSNAPEMVWLATGQPARMLRPSRKLERELAADVAASGRPCTVVWFMEDGKPVLHVDEIAAEVDVERAWEGPRGLLVIARPRAGER